jgi:hypothetical protein
MPAKLTAADRKVLRRAIEEARSRWKESECNLGVMARAKPGLWPVPPDTAKRKQRVVVNRIAALDLASGKLQLD